MSKIVTMSNDNNNKKNKVTVLTIIGSLFAGWFGVQTNENRERDFTHGKFSTFIVAAIIFVILFVLFIVVVVNVVLHYAGV